MGFLTSLFGTAPAATPAEPVAAPEAEPAPAKLPRIAEVGWLLDGGEAQFIWGDPRRVRTFERNETHAKALNNCPAYLDYESRMFEVPCPVDVRLGFRRDDQGRPAITILDGDRSSVRGSHLNKLLMVSPPKEWRHAERPIIQLVTPYVFVADEPIWITQLPPVQHYRAEPWPGLLIGGRFPTHIWPRTMMWAFEWWDTRRELVLKRGEPWFYVNFEATDPARPVRLSEAVMTPDLLEYRKGISSVTNYVNQTYALFKTAEERRPERLFQPKRTSAAAPADDDQG